MYKSGHPSYETIHRQVKLLYGEELFCEHCKVTTKPKKQYHWANVSGKYNTLKREDWKRLCAKCHWQFDRRIHLNRRIASNNTSGYKNISWDKSRGKWLVSIKINGVYKNLGRFKELTNALKKRNEVLSEIH